MTISVGEKVPDVPLKAVLGGETSDVRTGELLGEGRVVLFGVPAAFSPTCSDFHLPGFALSAPEILGKGVTRIVCVAVNDAFAMRAWADAEQAGEILMLADAAAVFTTAMGMSIDTAGLGMGVRSRRYYAVLDDGVVSSLEIEAGLADHEVTSAEHVLTRL